jgi:MFS family permease
LNTARTPSLSLVQVLVFGSLMVTLSMGIRHGFGLFNLPITSANGWGRETYALAIALQNLVWGFAQPVAGALADRYGPFKIMVIGGLLYGLGLIGMALTSDPFLFNLAGGLSIGIGLAATTYSVVYGILGRNVSAEKRVWAMGITAAAGSFGQFLMMPLEQGLISSFGANEALIYLGLLASLMIPLAFFLRESNFSTNQGGNQTISEALREAMGNRNFRFLMMGYFVCGFQVVFITLHLAPYLKDMSLKYPEINGATVATTALALIGLFNVIGTYYAGVLGQRFPKRFLLSGIYITRSVAISLFLLIPLSATSTYVFAAVMGVLWLSTIPLTNAIVAQIFGVKYLTMLSGLVFFSHQLGSFCGAYFGGYLYDLTGSYQIVWGIAIALGVFACLINLPIREEPLVRPAMA